MGIIENMSGISKVREKDNITIYREVNNLFFIAIKENNITGKILPVIDLNKNDYTNFDIVDSTYNTLNNRAYNTMLIIFNLNISNMDCSISTINTIINSLDKVIQQKGYSINNNIFILEKNNIDKKLADKLKTIRPTMDIPYDMILNIDKKDTNKENNSLQANESEDNNTSNGETSKAGFINIVLLTTIIAGVTIFSIELGKYLYYIYG